MTGQIGTPGTGLHPLRGQNNVQGASDSGLIPMMYPDYQRVDNAVREAKFEKLWGTPLDQQPGLTVVEIIREIQEGTIFAACTSWGKTRPCRTRTSIMRVKRSPQLDHPRHAGNLPDGDVLLWLTSFLPATAWPEKDRDGDEYRPAWCSSDVRRSMPPGEAKPDLWIIQQIARRSGPGLELRGPSEVFDEMRKAMPSIAGITWERLEARASVTYPCERKAMRGSR